MEADAAECRAGDSCGFRYPALLNPWFLAAAAVMLAIVAQLSTYVNDEAIWGYCGWLWSAHGNRLMLAPLKTSPWGFSCFTASPGRCLAKRRAGKGSRAGGAGRNYAHTL